jgi:hypothetical protein
MPTILHILTRPSDELAQGIIRHQKEHPDTRVIVADLTVAEPDYATLVTQVFEADSIQSW